MLAEAAGFAILAALTPTALLVAAVFLGTADPHRTVLFYLAGAIVMTGVMAAIAFVVLRAGQLYLPRNHQARYEVRLGLGVGCLLAAAYLLRRGARKRDPAKQGQGLISRMAARPGHKAAFIVGLLVYTPSVTFIAAVQVVATSNASLAASVGALAIVVVITVMFVWLPLVLYLVVPERTGRWLGQFDGWLRTHGHAILIGALAVAGLLLAVNGILGLAGLV